MEKVKEELLRENISLQQEIVNRNQIETKMLNLFAAVGQTVESIIILDRKGFIEYTNPTFEIITGFSKEEVYGSRVKGSVIGPVSINDYKKIARSLIKEGKWQGVYLAKKKDGTMYEEEASILVVKDINNKTINYVAVCRDISEQKRLESIVDSVDMMKNVGYIFAGIRHELANPINSIKTSLSVLKKGLDSYSYEAILVYIERALSELARVEYILKVLKSFSMFEKLKLERINLVSFIENFCCLAKEDCQKKEIKLNFNYTNNEIFVFVDPRAFHQVMLNIFSNAVDALEKRTNPTINIFLSVDNRFVKIEIIDNGIGLTDSQKEKLFKPFHTFKTQGTGLGLVITKKLINNMQGTIDIDSSYNYGTKVIVILNNMV